MNASVFRKTRFELVQLVQGPNSFGIVASERGVLGSRPPNLEIHETAFSDKEMSQVHAVLAMLEDKFATVYDAWAGKPERIHEAITKATEAETRRKLAELEAQRIELAQVEKRAELAALDAAIAAKAALVAEPEVGK